MSQDIINSVFGFPSDRGRPKDELYEHLLDPSPSQVIPYEGGSDKEVLDTDSDGAKETLKEKAPNKEKMEEHLNDTHPRKGDDITFDMWYDQLEGPYVKPKEEKKDSPAEKNDSKNGKDDEEEAKKEKEDSPAEKKDSQNGEDKKKEDGGVPKEITPMAQEIGLGPTLFLMYTKKMGFLFLLISFI